MEKICPFLPHFIVNPCLSDTPASTQSSKKKKVNVTLAVSSDNDDDNHSRPNNGSARKKCRALQPKKEAPRRDRTKMGIFYAKTPSKKIAHTFPPGIDACPKFSTRGYKCDKYHNECKDVFEARNILMDQIEAIGNILLADGSDWFNKESSVRINLKPKYRTILGDANVSEHA